MNLYKNYMEYIKEELTPEEIEERRKNALEAKLASNMKMYLSKRLMDHLRKMESPIAKELLNLSRKKIRFDFSFMDLTSKSGQISYMKTAKVKKLEENGLNIEKARNDYNSELWTSSQRIVARVNRTVQKIFKNKFTTADYEKFGNEFIALIEKDNARLRVVYGKEINKWYLEKYYKELKSSLGGSCMRQSSRNSYLDFYAYNTPDKGNYSYVGLLILLDDNDKLLGRAIIWFNSIKPEPGRIFMDRVYTTKDSDIDIFKNYAKKNGWLYKEYQSYDKPAYIDPHDGRRHTMTLSFRLEENKKYDSYPFLDTVMYYTPKTGRISNTTGINKKFEIYKCRSTGGGYETIQ